MKKNTPFVQSSKHTPNPHKNCTNSWEELIETKTNSSSTPCPIISSVHGNPINSPISTSVKRISYPTLKLCDDENNHEKTNRLSYIKTRILDQDGDFLIDSGATISILNQSTYHNIPDRDLQQSEYQFPLITDQVN